MAHCLRCLYSTKISTEGFIINTHRPRHVAGEALAAAGLQSIKHHARVCFCIQFLSMDVNPARWSSMARCTVVTLTHVSIQQHRRQWRTSTSPLCQSTRQSCSVCREDTGSLGPTLLQLCNTSRR